jgi:hypothetical protein
VAFYLALVVLVPYTQVRINQFRLLWRYIFRSSRPSPHGSHGRESPRRYPHNPCRRIMFSRQVNITPLSDSRERLETFNTPSAIFLPRSGKAKQASSSSQPGDVFHFPPRLNGASVYRWPHGKVMQASCQPTLITRLDAPTCVLSRKSMLRQLLQNPGSFRTERG